jgi:hypothetical protein
MISSFEAFNQKREILDLYHIQNNLLRGISKYGKLLIFQLKRKYFWSESQGRFMDVFNDAEKFLWLQGLNWGL